MTDPVRVYARGFLLALGLVAGAALFSDVGAQATVVNTATVITPAGISDPQPQNNVSSATLNVTAAAPAYSFCSAPGGTATSNAVFSMVGGNNGVRISRYEVGAATDAAVDVLALPSVTGNVNGLMVDPVTDRLLFHATTGSMLWAYDADNGGWYQALSSAVPVVDLPRAGMDRNGVGYLVAGAGAPTVYRVTADASGFGYAAQNIGNLQYDVAPTNLGSGDIAFDAVGFGWLSAGVDLYRIDFSLPGNPVAVRQTRPLLNGQPSTISWAGVAFGDDGRLYVADNSATSSYYAYDPATGALTRAASTSLGGSRDLASCAYPAPLQADLSVVKSLAQVNGVAATAATRVRAGDQLNYAIAFTNNGGAADTLFPGEVRETVPANTVHVAGRDGFACTGTSCSNTAALNVPAGGTVTVSFIVDVVSPLPASATSIANTVSFNGDVLDCAAPGNVCSVTTPVGPAVAVSKSADIATNTAVTAGQTLTYTLTATIANAAILSDVVLTDTLGDGLTFGAVVEPGSFVAGGTGAVRTFTLPAGTAPGTYTVRYTADVDADATVRVTNSVIAAGGDDPNAPSPVPPVCTSCSTSHPLAASSVTIVKTADPASGTTVAAGTTLTYTLSATVADAATTEVVTLTDTLGAGLSFGAVTSPGILTCTGSLSCTLPSGTVPGTYTVSYTATVDADAVGTLRNAVVASVPPGGTQPTPVCTTCTTEHNVLPQITATDDPLGPVNGAAGNPNAGNAYDNDTLGGAPVDPADIIGRVTTPATPINGGLVPVLDPATGVVSVPAGTPAGSYEIEYEICDALNRTNCATATITVTVDAPVITAVDDTYTGVNGASGDSAVGNVLDGDTLNGVVITDPSLVDITIVGTLPPQLTVDLDAGVIGVLPGTPAGNYTFDYQICEVLNPTNCSTATVTITVDAPVITAVDDTYTGIDGTSGDPAVGNVLDGDTLNGVAITDPSLVDITIVGTLPPQLTVDLATGVIGVLPGTPAGDYTFDYQICEVLNPSNCSIATVTITVEAPLIAAVDDIYTGVNGASGDPAVGNVLDGDTLSGVAITDPSLVDITIVGTLPPQLTVDLDTGAIGVLPGTPAGDYTFEYQICEVLNPTNCSTATVKITVEAPAIVAIDDTLDPVNGGSGNPNVGNVLDGDTLNGQPITDPSLVDITIVGTLPGGITVDLETGVIGVAPGTPAGDYTFEYEICEVLNPTNCSTASVTITVVAPDVTAVDDSTTTDQNTPVTIPVLDNDTLNGVPVDPDNVTITVTPPGNGSVVVNPDGSIVYTPAPGFAGDDSFTYTICETTNPDNCATATVVVTVRPNVVEAIDDDAGTAESGVPLQIVVVGNDRSTGAPLDPNSITVITPAGHGSVVCANGICTYTPEFGFAGEDRFTYRVCDTSFPAAICDTATVTIRVEGVSPLRVTKTAAVREVKVGDLVRYTVTVENIGNAVVSGASVVDTPPAGFSYVDGSLAASDGRALSVTGARPIRIASLDLAPGDSLTMSYLLRVGAGIRAGGHVNQVQAQSAGGIALSNVATAQVQTAFDPLLDDSLVFGTVFDDRNGDGWQASAALRDVRVQGGFAPGAYIAGSTTIDHGDGPQPLADASAPLLHGVVLDTIAGRQSVADPVEANQIVIRQRLRSADFTGDFVLTSGDGATLRMSADGSTRLERSGDVAKGLSAAEPVVTRRVSQDGEGVLVEYVIGNVGIDERGIPGVRIASVEGLLIETDQYGRYHLVDVPGGTAAHGRNFILKVDPATLPLGTTFTTANPLVRRVTAGLPVRFDFGVRLPVVELQAPGETVEMTLGEVMFDPDSSALRADMLPAIEAMAREVDRHGSGSIVITGEGGQEALAFARAASVRDALQGKVSPAAAQALQVELRTRVEDPHALVAGVGNGDVLLGTVLFDTDRATIRPEFAALLDAVAARLETLGGGVVGIVGHTDVRGAHAYNVDLGLRRARAVYDALAGRLSPEVRANTRVEATRDPAAPVGEVRK
ncbi:MAG: Ig-like domain-containing protein [Luteimonas sp.]